MAKTKQTIAGANRWHHGVKAINFEPNAANMPELEDDANATLYLQRNNDGTTEMATRAYLLGPYAGPHCNAAEVMELVGENAINVISLGADPTGRTGSSDAINLAITKVAARGYGRVYIPAGLYLIDQTIVQKSLCWIHGDGKSTYLKAADKLDGPMIQAYVDTNVTWSYMMALSDMRLDGNRENQTTGTGCYGVEWGAPTGSGTPTFETELIGTQRSISVTAGQWFDSNRLMWNLFVSYCGDHGIYMHGRGGIHVDSCVSYQNGGHGFWPTYDTTLVNCEAARNSDAGFYVDQASVRLAGCKAWWSGYQGYPDDVYGGDELDGHGFHLRSDYGVTLANCEAQDNYANGFYFENASMIEAVGCVADSNNRRNGDNVGVDFWESHNCRWEGFAFDRYNDSVRYQDYAVRFRSNSEQNQVKTRHRYFNGGASTSKQQIISHIEPASTLVNNNHVEINNYEGWQSAGGTSAISPSPYFGKRCLVNLTEDMTISHVSGQAHEYIEMEYFIQQDGTGGWAITWSSDFDLGPTPPTFTTTANSYTTIRFVWNGSKWVMTNFQTGV